MKMNKRSKLLTSCILTISIVTTVFSSMVFAKPDYTKVAQIAIEQKVKKVLSDGYSKYYKINSLEVKFDDLHIEENQVEGTLLASMNNTLKMSKVEDLPYVKGMLKEVNLSDYTHKSKSKLDEAISKVNNEKTNIQKLDNEQLSKVSQHLDFKLNSLNQYINKANDNNLYLKVTASVNNGAISQDSIKIFAENVDTYVPVEEMFPKSSDVMEAEGSKDIQMVIKSKGSLYSPSVYSNYTPSDARYYSSIYTSNPSSCYDDGTSCGIYQARNYWNNSQYNYYSELKHNDCADFVSQALSYGGLPEDDSWYATKYSTDRAYNWVNTAGLKSYMTSKGYWVSTSFSYATEGAVMYTAPDHVVMIAQNDSITHTYNGHTNDRYRASFSNSSSFAYYKLW